MQTHAVESVFTDVTVFGTVASGAVVSVVSVVVVVVVVVVFVYADGLNFDN